MTKIVTLFLALLAIALLMRPSAGANVVVDGPSTRPVSDKIPHTTVQIDMVRVPGGTITRKDKDGQEIKYIIEPFLIQRTEARWQEWDVFYFGLDLPDEGLGHRDTRARDRRDAMLRPSPQSYFPYDRGFGHDGWPIQGITLHAVRTYIEWLNGATGKRYRLPTEVEWEWCCRAGSSDASPTGKALERVAWFADNAGEAPHRVATKAPNAWGLYDMLGNVGEWVIRADESAVLAGGSHQDKAADIGVAAREVPDDRKWQSNNPGTPRPIRIWLGNGTHVGFRLVRELERGEQP